MIGSWRWNLISAAAFAVVIFLLSYSHNPIGTAASRSAITFIILFGVTYAVRWLLGQATAAAAEGKQEAATPEAYSTDEEGKGQSIDIVTPDQDEEPKHPFSPLSPPKLARTDEFPDAERLAEAVRHMSEK
jgi:hypothetical protein